MKTLVLCVDRDDDLGTKAGIAGPVIGRQENLSAAQKLGLADPEDVDTNSMLSAISLYDDLVKKGIEAEIATITGDIHVGFQSDLIITRQLENLLEVVKPDRAILVSDGEEDEYIYPIISSRVKIDSVKRVFVRQSESLEGFYYLLVKSLKDVKIRTKWVLPLALVLIIYGSLTMSMGILGIQLNPDTYLDVVPNIGFSIILIMLGAYMIWWAFEFGSKARKVRKAIREGSLSIPFALVAALLIFVGLFLGYDSASAYTSTVLPSELSYGRIAVLFVQTAVWPFVLAMFSYESGRAITSFLHLGKLRWQSIITLMSVMAIGFVIQGMADLILYFITGDVAYEWPIIFAEVATGIMVAIFGAVLRMSLRTERNQERAEEAASGSR